jgi:hypothetical protein
MRRTNKKEVVLSTQREIAMITVGRCVVEEDKNSYRSKNDW